jgi:hypothetical protein
MMSCISKQLYGRLINPNMLSRLIKCNIRMATVADERGERIEALTAQLFQCEKSWNLFMRLRSQFLRDQIFHLRQQEAADRQQQRADEVRDVWILDQYDSEAPEIRRVTRRIFEEWAIRNTLLKEINVVDGREPILKNVLNFEDIQPQTYYLLVSGANKAFGGHANTEGVVQTMGCVKCIVDGKIHIPIFSDDVVSETAIYYEPAFYGPIGENGNKFNFPVKPDALIIRGTIWVFVESKHTCTNAYIKTFEEKVDFVWRNREQSWLRKNHPVPTMMVVVVSSIGPYSPQTLPGSKVVRTIRSHQSHDELAP